MLPNKFVYKGPFSKRMALKFPTMKWHDVTDVI